jgi:hypothetical protein
LYPPEVTVVPPVAEMGVKPPPPADLAIPPPSPRTPRMGDSFLKNLSNMFIPPYHS